jgi:hypothetical protein
VATFTDPQGQKLSYFACLSNGQPLPGWLAFNPATETFSGTAPATTQSLTIKVTATDTSGLAASETFSANVTVPTAKPGISVSAQTAPQTWTDGQSVDLVLPASTFSDALGLKMTFAAYQVSGPDVTSWLRFNPTTDELIGKVPTNASGTAWLAVVASDSQNVSAMDLFPVTFASASTHGVSNAGSSLASASTIEPSHLAQMLVLHS